MRNWHGNLSPFGSWHTGRRVFNPLSLFANGEPGVWFDPSPTTTFTDTAGTTPATVGSAVALMLDKSKGLALGPELGNAALLDKRPATDGTVTRSGGIITFTSAASGLSVAISQEITGLTVGRTYRFNGRMRRTVGTTVCVPQIRTADGGGGSGLLTGPLIGSDFTSFSLLWVATQTSAHFSFSAGATSQTIEVDEAAFSVRELPGNHATQPTLASRPILGRVPARGRVNLLTRTEEFDNAYWTKQEITVSANAETAPDGTTTADKIIPTAVSSTHQINRLNVVTSQQCTLSFYAKPAGYNTIRVLDGAVASNGADFNLSTGASTNVGTGVGSSVFVGDGWYRFSLTVVTTGVRFYVPTSASNFTGDGTSGIFIWGAQLETGTTATNYQRVTDQFDITEAGQPNNYYLFHGGSADPRWMITPTITPGTDKVQVFAGVRKLSDAARGTVAETSATIASNNGAFQLTAPNAASATYGFESKGTTLTDAVGTPFAAPITNVITGIGDIAGDNATIRVNAAQQDQDTGDQGTGNFLAYPLYIGARAGTSLYFNGQVYSLIARFGPNLDANTIERTERYVASKTAGVSIP